MKIMPCALIVAIVSTAAYALNNEPITTREGKKFVIKLPVTGGTGYTWELENLKNLKNDITVLSSKVEPLAVKIMPGSANIQRFQLRALPVKGQPSKHLYLIFAKRRPWEKDQPAVEIRTIEVIVKSGK